MQHCAVFVALAAAVACGPSVNVEDERAALMASDREWSQATTEPEKFAAFFADGGSIYPPGMPIITGSEAIRKSYSKMSGTQGFSLSWVPTKAEVSASGSWKKQADGTWKVTEDIFNADQAPKAPAGTHAMVPPNALKWGDAPPGMPAGMLAAVVSGRSDPGAAVRHPGADAGPLPPKTVSTIQVHGLGPFDITYINPADDPRTKKSN